VAAATSFPNLRVKEVEGRTISLPDYCDPAYRKDKFEPAGRIGGPQSFVILRGRETQEGAELPPDDDLTRAKEIGIVVEVGDDALDVSTSRYLEEKAVESISMIRGLRPERKTPADFALLYGADATPLASQLAGAITAGLRQNFPLLERICVRILTDPVEVTRQRAAADRFRAQRDAVIAAESDDTVSYFHYCIECQPFSREHVCVITPDRPPMCSRDRFQIKAAVLFGASWHPWKRRGIAEAPLRDPIKAEKPLDEAAGEYAAINAAVTKLSDGRVTRVHLHSLRQFPHTSCGCFGFIAFWMDKEQGIGVMERGYAGSAPGSITWDYLANAAGGKQSPGLAGISGAYLRSRRFLAGDGGRAAIRWLSPKAYEKVKDLLPPDAKVIVGQ